MSRKRKSVTAWAVFDSHGTPVTFFIRRRRVDAIFAAVLGLYDPWELLKKRGYTVRKVTITEAR